MFINLCSNVEARSLLAKFLFINFQLFLDFVVLKVSNYVFFFSLMNLSYVN